MARLLFVDDEKMIQEGVLQVLKEDGFQVDIANNGLDALKMLAKNEYYLVISDYKMPGFDGVELCKKVRTSYPKVPFVLLTGLGERARSMFTKDFRPPEALIEKPINYDMLIEVADTFHSAYFKAPKILSGKNLPPVDAILIGASTGGTGALAQVLKNIDSVDCPPIIIVQHIPENYGKALGLRLASSAGLNYVIPEDLSPIENGNIYLADGRYHLGLEERNSKLTIRTDQSPPMNGHQPSVDYLFYSAARCSKRRKFLAIILTGMGVDGAKGLLELKNVGSTITIAQNPASCVVFGMPREAIKLDAAEVVADPGEIRDIISGFSNKKRKAG